MTKMYVFGIVGFTRALHIDDDGGDVITERQRFGDCIQ